MLNAVQVLHVSLYYFVLYIVLLWSQVRYLHLLVVFLGCLELQTSPFFVGPVVDNRVHFDDDPCVGWPYDKANGALSQEQN